MPYKPNYRMYSKPQDGWHDEPFEYVFSYYNTGVTVATQAAETFNFLNNPLQMDPDADFYPIGEWPTYEEALEAARSSLDELNLSQPDAGGQFGIQDRVYVVHPDGRRQRVFP